MQRGLALAVILATSPLQAQEVAKTGTESVAARYAAAVVDGCLPMAQGDMNFTASSVTEDEQHIRAQGFEYGISGDIYDRFGLQGSSVLNRAIMGHRQADEAVFVLAIGGALPGCKVILLTPEEGSLEDDVSAAFGTLEPEWRELPFAQSRPGSKVTMRRFIMRDDDHAPFLINLITTPIPDSQVRLLATLSPIPSHVQIPEGF